MGTCRCHCRARWRSVDCFMIGMAAQLILNKNTSRYEPLRNMFFRRFDVADMGDFIRSPQFAGTLRREAQPCCDPMRNTMTRIAAGTTSDTDDSA